MIDHEKLKHARQLLDECSVKGTNWASAMQAMLEGNIVRRVGWADSVVGISITSRRVQEWLWLGKPHFLLIWNNQTRSTVIKWDKWVPYDSDFTATDWIVVCQASGFLGTVVDWPKHMIEED